MRGLTFLCSVAVAAMVGTFQVPAAEESAAVLKSTAFQLDDLVSQKKVAYKEIIRPGYGSQRVAVPPISLDKIAPKIATRLRLPEKEVLNLLKDDRQKLSGVVLARALEPSVGKKWQDLLAQHDEDQLLRLAEERQLTASVKNTMDELYTEVSFAALDAMQASKGSAAQYTQGQNSATSSAKEKQKD